jgi:hypothetical protein
MKRVIIVTFFFIVTSVRLRSLVVSFASLSAIPADRFDTTHLSPFVLAADAQKVLALCLDLPVDR